MAYKANPQISVDDVKLAVFAKVKTPDTSRSESDFSDDSSSGDSSCNDIELGSSELAFPGRRAKARVAASQRSEPENVRIFQPASKREVFIDGSPEKVDVKSSAKARQTVLNSDGVFSPFLLINNCSNIYAWWTSRSISQKNAFFEIFSLRVFL